MPFNPTNSWRVVVTYLPKKNLDVPTSTFKVSSELFFIEEADFELERTFQESVISSPIYG